jgi:predicted Zn-dependent peptidase
VKVFDYEPTFKKTVLAGGVRVVTERHPTVRSVCAGIFVDCGSRDEPRHLKGATHFLEHLVFKRTKLRTAYEIARDLEAVGGDLNAYTHREVTCFHGTTLKEHLAINLDVLTDLVSQANWSTDDFNKERGVILQEIDMTADQLEEAIYDRFMELFYPQHSLGASILGTEESLKSFKSPQLRDYYRSHYHGPRLVVSVSGDVDHGQVVEQVQKRLDRRMNRLRAQQRLRPRVKAFRKVEHRASEHVHLIMGWPSCTFTDRLRYEALIVNTLLGGGMTSRLYQSVREDRGLVYSIYSSLHAFSDAGVLMVYAGTSEENLATVYKIIRREIEKLRVKGVSQKELDFYRTQVKGQLLLGADDMDNRMTSLGVNELVFGDYRPVHVVLEDLERITPASLQQYIDRYLSLDRSGVLVWGDLKIKEVEKQIKES